MTAAHAAAPICRPLQGLTQKLSPGSWGSRPRLIIYRASGAHHSTTDDGPRHGIRGLVPQVLLEVLREVGAVDVEVDDPGVVANCNAPEALELALRRRIRD